MTAGSIGKLLGDLRAEHDHPMLEEAFLETPDYRTLASGPDRPIVVGRRGTGKSALAYRLRKDFSADSKTLALEVSPSEDQIIGLRPLIELFGSQFAHIRAGSRIAWRYALLMEIVRSASRHYRFSKAEQSSPIRDHLRTWSRPQFGERDVSYRLRERLKSVVDQTSPPAARIGELATSLRLHEVESGVPKLLDEMGIRAVIFADRLDEGYEPDDIGVGLVAGFVQATVDLNTAPDKTRAVIFLRDNIYRTVAREDPDFSRNIEGHVLRLHWDDHLLLHLVSNRLRRAFHLSQEQDVRIWNSCVTSDLQTMDGFRRCLRLTLYRPRDLLALMNDAYLNSGTNHISMQNVEGTAQSISTSRLDDLRKEYANIFPSLPYLLDAFREHDVEITLETAAVCVDRAKEAAINDPGAAKELEILETSANILRALYSVGFIGIRESNGSYVFCHDGKKPDRSLELGDRLLIHPCYWMGLNLKGHPIDREEAAEIHDDYSIAVASATPEIRSQRLGQLISEFGNIPTGQQGSSQFEEWCREAIRVVFAGSLTNVELHPNKAATQRRDVVATNSAEKGVWRRIYEDYKARQVLFEIKNFADIGPDAYRQMHSYLGNHYGKLGFIITRDENDALLRGKDLRWIRELYNRHGLLIVRLTGGFLRKRLAKLRSPQKHNEAENTLNKLLDSYERLYLSDAALKGID